MRLFEEMRSDYQHYCVFYSVPKRFFLLNVIWLAYTNPGYAIVLSYRFSRFVATEVRFAAMRFLLKLISIPAHFIARQYSGCEISHDACIEGGLVIVHFGGIIVTGRANIGRNCIMFQGVNIVDKNLEGATIGNDVRIGAHAIIIGNCVIGDRVTIGAGSVVTKSFPDDVVIAGVPAKILGENKTK